MITALMTGDGILDALLALDQIDLDKATAGQAVLCDWECPTERVEGTVEPRNGLSGITDAPEAASARPAASHALCVYHVRDDESGEVYAAPMYARAPAQVMREDQP